MTSRDRSIRRAEFPANYPIQALRCTSRLVPARVRVSLARRAAWLEARINDDEGLRAVDLFLSELAAIAQVVEVYEREYPPDEGASLVTDDVREVRLSDREEEILLAIHEGAPLSVSKNDWTRLRRLFGLYDRHFKLTTRGLISVERRNRVGGKAFREEDHGPADGNNDERHEET